MLIQKDLVVILETSSVGQNRHFACSVYPLACRGMPITISLDVCVSYTFEQKNVRKHVLLAKISETCTWLSARPVTIFWSSSQQSLFTNNMLHIRFVMYWLFQQSIYCSIKINKCSPQFTGKGRYKIMLKTRWTIILSNLQWE